MSDFVVIDTETTGLDTETDEILEIAIIDGSGEVVLKSLVDPITKSVWPEAQLIHGITPEDVESAPTLEDLRSEIAEAVHGKLVVIYNAEFDSQMLSGFLDGAADIHCAMTAFSQEYAIAHEETERRHKLVHAAHYVGHDWGQDAAHRAIHDASATLSVWHWCHRQDPAAHPVEVRSAA